MAEKEHLQLSQFIKSVHENLRSNSRSVGWKEAWLDHCNKREVLEEYAAAMHRLATKYWESNAECHVNSRVDWVVKQCEWYFFGDGLKNITDRDLVKISRIENEVSKDLPIHSSAKSSGMQFEKPLLMLDVGSCYNPLKLFPIFNTIAIDLAPATADVFQCDFLELKVTDVADLSSFGNGSHNVLTLQSKQCELPSEVFDVVNFSLFLEYLPSSQLRFECCNKAFNLLKPGGLLFIITPDSKHASANAPLMRGWRIALGTIGFVRTSYQKLTHLHCMAFRKCPYPILQKNLVERFRRYAKVLPSDMIVIPQDRSVTTNKDVYASSESKSDLDTVDINLFSELPISF